MDQSFGRTMAKALDPVQSRKTLKNKGASMGWLGRGAIGLAVLAMSGYGALCGYMYARQDALVYPGGTTAIQPLPAPDSVGLKDFQPITLDTSDGEHLKAWWRPPEDGRGVILYLQGNAQSLAAPWRVARLRDIADAGYGILGLEYRGFGGSTGNPSEPGLIADAEAGYDLVARKAPGAKTILFGDSLGAAVAIALATKRPVAGLMLDSPFASAERLGHLRYPWVPIGILMRDKWPSDERVKNVTAPILIASCDQDRVVPPSEPKRLFDAAFASNPKDMIFSLNNCGHVQTWREEPTKRLAFEAFAEWSRGTTR